MSCTPTRAAMVRDQVQEPHQPFTKGITVALHWDTRACDERIKNEKEWGITESLIFATMAVDMGSITEANVTEFAERLAAWQILNGSILRGWDDENKKFVDLPVTMEMLQLRIGLKTNVATTTKTQFKAKLNRLLKEKVREAVRANS
jgi:hypothetical protein